MSRQQKQKETSLVRMLCYVLGTAPAEFGLAPDDEGWVKLKELVKALGEEESWRFVRESMIKDAAARLAPTDLEVDGAKVRCLSRRPPRPQYGVEVPVSLYLAVRPRAWPVIKQQGLSGSEDEPLLLAVEKDFALRLGRRRTAQPVLLTIQAQRSLEQGADFARLGDNLYLGHWVPADCLLGPPVGEKPAQKKPVKIKIKGEPAQPRMPSPDAMPGSFMVTAEDMEKPYKRKGLRKDVTWKNQRRQDRRKKD